MNDDPSGFVACPHCAARTEAEMPTDACLFFFECPACRVVLRPKPGDCCVFCSYGDDPCPPVRRAAAGQGQGNCAGQP